VILGEKNNTVIMFVLLSLGKDHCNSSLG